MEKVVFRIERTGLNKFVWNAINAIISVCTTLIVWIKTENLKITTIFLIIFAIPLFLYFVFRNKVVIQNDKMSIYSGMSLFIKNIDISEVSNVHYKQVDEIEIVGSLGFCVRFEKNEQTVCFVSKKGYNYYIATKDHEKLYALLKAREKIE